MLGHWYQSGREVVELTCRLLMKMETSGQDLDRRYAESGHPTPERAQATIVSSSAITLNCDTFDYHKSQSIKDRALYRA